MRTRACIPAPLPAGRDDVAVLPIWGAQAARTHKLPTLPSLRRSSVHALAITHAIARMWILWEQNRGRGRLHLGDGLARAGHGPAGVQAHDDGPQLGGGPDLQPPGHARRLALQPPRALVAHQAALRPPRHVQQPRRPRALPRRAYQTGFNIGVSSYHIQHKDIFTVPCAWGKAGASRRSCTSSTHHTAMTACASTERMQEKARPLVCATYRTLPWVDCDPTHTNAQMPPVSAPQQEACAHRHRRRRAATRPPAGAPRLGACGRGRRCASARPSPPAAAPSGSGPGAAGWPPPADVDLLFSDSDM